MRNMSMKFVGNLALLVHNDKTPTDEEALACLKQLLTHDVSLIKALIWTDGGGPNAAQRKTLNDALGGKTYPTAVIASTTMVRGIVTALSWFNSKMKAFSPDEMDQALAYLDIPRQDHAIVKDEIEKLKLTLKFPATKNFTR